MDRASGSGVFARDPDALVDLVELELTDEIIQQRCDQLACDIYKDAINRMNRPYMEQYIGLDDLRSPYQMRNHFEKAVVNIQDRWQTNELINRETSKIQTMSAWRVDGTLREFAKFKPRNVWFSYPLHIVDETGILDDIELDDSKSNPWWKKNFDKKNTPEQRKEERKIAFDTAYSALNDGMNPVTSNELCEYMGISEKTLKRRIKELKGYEFDGENIVLKK